MAKRKFTIFPTDFFKFFLYFSLFVHLFIFYLTAPEFVHIKQYKGKRKVTMIKLPKDAKKKGKKGGKRARRFKKSLMYSIKEPIPEQEETTIEDKIDPDMDMSQYENAIDFWGAPELPDGEVFTGEYGDGGEGDGEGDGEGYYEGDDTAVDLSNLTKNPVQIKDVLPVYPRLASETGFKGTVIASVLLSKEGIPEDIIILKSPESKFKKEFEKSAIDAIKEMRWTPGYQGDRAVPVWIGVVVRFTLE